MCSTKKLKVGTYDRHGRTYSEIPRVIFLRNNPRYSTVHLPPARPIRESRRKISSQHETTRLLLLGGSAPIRMMARLLLLSPQAQAMVSASLLFSSSPNRQWQRSTEAQGWMCPSNVQARELGSAHGNDVDKTDVRKQRGPD
ncbi:hypothetical protein KSP40_PGU017093 [Platanthera guangdongensis]|uniref:Uncharacterized protein n=1 Tax=Platanthera guangdongensis TaxID=2320717 RepID=A0ABR2MZX7_9ASPA